MSKQLLSKFIAIWLVYVGLTDLSVYGQAPGGVSGFAAWYKGNAGMTSSVWNDQSSNAYHLTGTNNPVVDSFVNFNPVATFNGSNQRYNSVATAKAGWPSATEASTYYYVAKNTGSSSNRCAIGFGANGNLTGIHSGQTSTGLISTGGASDLTSTGFVTVASPPSWSVTEHNNGLNLVRTGYSANNYISAQGHTEITGTNITPTYANTAVFSIGTRGVGGGVFWSGNVAEVIVYPGKHDATNASRVESYLALKYGITKTGDYVNSGGQTIYNAVTNTGYLNNIAGIIYDATSGLNQKQSISQNTGSQLLISTTGIAGTNDLNGTSLASGQALIWGDNGLNKKLSVFIDGVADVNYRFSSIWKVQNTGSTGVVRVLWPSGIENLKLIVSSDTTFTSSDEVHNMHTHTQTVNGVVYNYADVTIPNGYYFTLAGKGAAPGGVTEGLKLWYDATIGGTTTTWDARNTNFQLSKIGTGTLTLAPGNNTSNFNPYYEFPVQGGGSGTHFSNQLPASGDMSPASLGRLHTTFAVGAKAGNIEGTYNHIMRFANTQTSGASHLFGLGINTSSNNPALFYLTGGGTQERRHSETLPLDMMTLISGQISSVSSGNNKYVGYNGTYTAFSDAITADVYQHFQIGGSSNGFGGKVPEVVYYSTGLSETDRARVNSYLAIKYGVTLVQPMNYVSSRGTVIWNSSANTGFGRNIAAIVHDENSGLYQKQSNSVNAGTQVLIGAGGALANTNGANIHTLNNGQSLVWGDNGLSKNLSVMIDGITDVNYRFSSIWKVQNTGNVGIVRVMWPAGIQNIKLMVSNDSVFTAADNIYDMDVNTQVVNGVTYNYADVTIPDGYYFTFAGWASAPGGVVSDLRIWLKSDSGFSPSSWIDHSGNSNDYTQTHITRQPFQVAGVASTNFNPTVDFGGSGSDARFMVVPSGKPYSADGLNSSMFITLRKKSTSSEDYLGFGATTTGSGLTQANNPVLTGYSNSTTFRVFPYDASNTPVLTISDYLVHHIIDASYVVGVSPITYGLNGQNGTRSSSVAITDSRTASGSILGSQTETAQAYMQEVIAYERELTVVEKQRVRSYMAIKAGITLAQPMNYVSARNSVIWDASTNAAYGHNIAAIARDDYSGLYQKQSNSVNAGGQVLIGIGGALANTNGANTNTLEEGQFLIWGDNGLAKSLQTPIGNISDVNYRMAAVWKVQNTDTVGMVRVMWPLGVEKIKLIVSDDNVFTHMDNIYDMYVNTQVINGVTYNYADVTLPDGYYFTFAGYACAPGGVLAGLKFWYDAGVGSTTTTWDARNTNFQLTKNGNATPVLASGNNTSNFNPYYEFTNQSGANGAHFTRQLPASGDLSSASLGRLHTTFAIGAKSGNIDATYNHIMRFGDGPGSGVTHRFALGVNTTTHNPTSHYINSGGTVDRRHTTGLSLNMMAVVSIQTSSATSGNNKHVGYNGNYQTFSDAITADVHQHFQIGGSTYGFAGKIPEVIYYNTSLSEAERLKVNSYLAIKYGVTLEQPMNYVSSLDSVIWNAGLNPAFNKNIFGIARDFTSCFAQNVSGSINPNSIAILATTNDFTSVNSHVSRISMFADQQYLMVGDNGIDTGVVALDTATCPLLAEGDVRLRKIWLAQRTNDTSAKYLQIDLSSYSMNSNIRLMISSDANLQNDVVLVPALSFTDDKAVFYIALPKYAYFTVVGREEPPACTVCTGGMQTLRNGRIWYDNRATSYATNTINNAPLTGTAPGSGTLSADVKVIDPGNVEYLPNHYPRWAGDRALLIRYDNKSGNDGKLTYSVKLKDANGSVSAKTSFSVSGITEWVRTLNDVRIVGYCGGQVVRPKLKHAYNSTPYLNNLLRSFVINDMTSTVTATKHRGVLSSYATVNVSFEKPVDSITIEWSRSNHYKFKVLSYLYISDMNFACNNKIEPTPDNVSVLASYINNNLATCQEGVMKIDFINNNCVGKTIDITNTLPGGLEYVPESYAGVENEIPVYANQSFSLSNLLLPPGTSSAYINVRPVNPAASGVYNTQFHYTVQGGLNSPNPYLSDDHSGQDGYQQTRITYTSSSKQGLPQMSAGVNNPISNDTTYLTTLIMPGDTLTYTYTFNNSTGIPMSNLELMDQITDSAYYVSGSIAVSAGVTFTANSYGGVDEEKLLYLQDISVPAGISTITVKAVAATSVNTIHSLATLSAGPDSECSLSVPPLSDSTIVTPACFRNGLLVPIDTNYSVTLPDNCFQNQWLYYIDEQKRAVIAIRPNESNWTPDDMIINTEPFVNKKSNGVDSSVVLQRLYTIKHSAALNNSVDVRLYYSQTEIDNQVPLTAYPIQGWFKHQGAKLDIEEDLTPRFLLNERAIELTPDESGTEFGLQYVQFNGISTFSTIGYTGNTSESILPVELISFTGYRNESSAVLDWNTASEVNNSGFEVQHSMDAVNFEKIGWVIGSGTSVVPNNYQFIHHQLSQGTHYYRLKQIDFDGQFDFSKIITLTNDVTAALKVYPLPAKSVIHLQNVESYLMLRILDSSGRLVETVHLNRQNIQSINVNNLAKGAYMLMLDKNDGSIETIKIMIQ